MGKVYERLSAKQKEWIEKQKIFFVATAPLAVDGLVNVSPKGLDSFRIIDDLTVAYLDLAGSGIETIAHLEENRRVTIMFTAFDGPPKSLRLYGSGKVHRFASAEFKALQDRFPNHTGQRSIIEIKLLRIQDSCGWSIPYYEYKGDRDTYDKWCQNQGRETIESYIENRNSHSLDKLPGF